MQLPGGNRLWVILIIGILVLSVGALSLEGGKLKEMRLFESVLYQLLRPFQKAITNIHHSVNDYWALLTSLKVIKQENEDLTKQVQKLESQLAEYNKTRLENQRLRKLLAFKELVSFETVGASVIGITPTNWESELVIDRGSKAGIKEKMPVISYNGALVGQISRVTPTTAIVTLLSDVSFAVGGRIEREDSRAIGIIRGQAEDKTTVLMDQIPWDAEIKEGDLVITSGLTNNFPVGIPIGMIVRVMEEDFGLIQQAEIKPIMSLTPIEEVLVITNF